MTARTKYEPNEFGSMSRHKPARLTVGERSELIDQRLVPLIRALWRANIDTWMSCQNHRTRRKVWIAFRCAADAEAFLNAALFGVQATEWAQQESWMFDDREDLSPTITAPGFCIHPAGWEFYASVYESEYCGGQRDGSALRIGVSVVFPPLDLVRVTRNVRSFYCANRGTKKTRGRNRDLR